ncbi:MAG: tRNA pseudouridine(38-40) synthase TruA [Planctomycetota bacterium]
MRVLLTVAYDGTSLAGWQRQVGQDTVQEHLENAFATLCGGRVCVEGAGRTDAGVHALRQCAHVDLPRPWRMQDLVRAVNAHLPAAVAVRAARPVPASFHARFSAAGKRYVYRFLTGPERPVHLRGFFAWSWRPLDVAAMRAGAAHLVGEHDFASFATNPGYPRKHGTVRRIDHLHVVRHRRGVDVAVQGNGFLYNMVRTIAGCLRDVGLGRRPAADLAAILAARDRRAASATLGPQGLFLTRVLYPSEALVGGVESPGSGADECYDE